MAFYSANFLSFFLLLLRLWGLDFFLGLGDVSGRDIGGEGSEGRVATPVEEGSPTGEHFLFCLLFTTSQAVCITNLNLSFFSFVIKPR